MNVKHQVFVSSTFVDLQEERRVVIENVMGMQCIPAGMELFEAGNDDQWTYIKRRIDESDYYVVIVAQRYGAIGPEGKSFTQMEYEYALGQGIPVAAFLLSDDARSSWPANKTEHGASVQIENFRSLCKQKLVKYWGSSHDLGSAVLTAIFNLQKEHPRPGWVRGDTVASELALKEIAKLSDEKRELQSQVAQLQSSAQPLNMPPDVRFRIERLNRTKVHTLLKFSDKMPDGISADLDYSVLNAFIDNSRSFAGHTKDWKIYDALIEKVCGKNIDDARRLIYASGVFDEMASQNLIDVSFQEEYDTFYVGTGRSITPNSVRYLSLSEYGKTFLLHAERWLSEEEPQHTQ